LNSGRRGGKPATNRLSYGAAFLTILIFFFHIPAVILFDLTLSFSVPCLPPFVFTIPPPFFTSEIFNQLSFWWESKKGNDHYEYLDVSGNIILKWVF
jgi:hypothetical protein